MLLLHVTSFLVLFLRLRASLSLIQWGFRSVASRRFSPRRCSIVLRRNSCRIMKLSDRRCTDIALPSSSPSLPLLGHSETTKNCLRRFVFLITRLTTEAAAN